MSRILSACMLTALSCCLLDNPASAADLRSTIDNRTFIRTVSVPVPEEKAETAATAQATVTPQPQATIVEEPSEIDDCDSACCVEAYCCPDLMWVGLDYLMWWRNGRYFPALVTGEDPGTLPASPVLFGGEQIGETARPGGRVDFGHWFDANHCLGIGGRFVALGDAPIDLFLSSQAPGGPPYFARPFIGPDDVPNAQVIANEGINQYGVPINQHGTLDLRSRSELLAADVFARWLLRRNGWLRLDLIAGYQFAKIDEDLVIDTYTNSLASPLIVQAEIYVHDAFSTRNEYHGGQVGLQSEYALGNWSLEVLNKFGFGSMREQVAIAGSRRVLPAAASTSGLLAQQATNAGVYTQDEFSYMQDVGVKLGYCPVARLKLTVGYSLMFWSRLVRPGDQIDNVIDVGLFQNPPAPGATRPAFQFASSPFLVQGLTFGLEYRF